MKNKYEVQSIKHEYIDLHKDMEWLSPSPPWSMKNPELRLREGREKTPNQAAVGISQGSKRGHFH